MLGQSVPVRASIMVSDSYSAHADQEGLAHWFASVPKKSGATTIVTHGDDDARATYAELLRDRFGARPLVPDLDQTIPLP